MGSKIKNSSQLPKEIDAFGGWNIIHQVAMESRSYKSTKNEETGNKKAVQYYQTPREVEKTGGVSRSHGSSKMEHWRSSLRSQPEK